MIRLLAARAVRVAAFVVAFLGVSAVSAFALPGEVHRYRLNQWTGLDDELTAGYNPLGTYGGATEAANTGRSDDGTTGTPGTPFTCLPATTLCEQGYRFGVGQGLLLENPAIVGTGPFTIVMDFMLDPTTGTHKILDFSGRCDGDPICNAGLYVSGNSATSSRRLAYIKDTAGTALGTAGQIVEDTISRVVLTRGDGDPNRIQVFVGGAAAGGTLTPWLDTAEDAELSWGIGETPSLIFFMDDLETHTSYAGGFVDTIRIFDRALDSSEVALLTEIDDLESSEFSEVPEPGTLMLMGAGLLVIGARLRKRHAAK